ncbi:peptidase S8 and S53 subtilisin kexin sedolisin [Catenulispora acidiphila DSM 44928]|uniref:Peptidase S8 and S53 subtilisin kexin sedolisin n=1 Tax=Catenulispora acidiphila (strain DSM 44928 / JCM 14897 / NBRC 102108 / NRRL B-24433 / ID139908) TaxID=479433 RepID=C7QFC6_CATAD|nr:peptidase S8 and S53 subtilisin kexin sedolisin [Catenulispora acidiphila DSM 44928]
MAGSLASASTSNQWALRYLRADSVWQISRGAGAEIAVIDTGVQANADVSNHLLPGADFSDSTTTSVGTGHLDTDSYGHGTGEASLIVGAGAETQGLAPDSNILPIRAVNGYAVDLALGITPAIEFAVSHKARVINLALGYKQDDPDIRRAVQDALDSDVVVVAAVGNDGSSQQYYPAALPGVVGVGAIDSSGEVWGQSNTGADVALVAPGVHILRDDNRGRVGYSDGTSEATAYVSAAAALVRSAHPGWSAGEVVAALEGTADKPAGMRGAVRDDRYGAGILDVLAAVRLAEPPVVGGSGAGVVRARQGGGSGWLWWVVGGGAVAGGVVMLFGVRRWFRRV